MRKTALSLTLALLAYAPAAQASIITIDVIFDSWSAPQPAGANPAITISNSPNPGTDSVRWGNPLTTAGQSGYDWNSGDTAFNVNTGVNFSLGTFTHINQPINGDFLTSIYLNFTVGNFDSPIAMGTSFFFSHIETPNTIPCTFPSNTPCADQVTINPDAFFNEPFTENGNNYFFTLLGFSTNAGVTINNTFVTQEGVGNNAELYAVITEAPIGVPDSGATLTLLGSALLGLAALRRKYLA